MSKVQPKRHYCHRVVRGGLTAKCLNCLWCHLHFFKAGECRRHSPRLYASGETGYPKTSAEDVCGDHEFDHDLVRIGCRKEELR